jgi:hypothetical protein
MRTLQDLQALAMRELSGDEKRGTVVAELTGAAIRDTADDVVSVLLKLATALGSPAGIQTQLKALASALSVSKSEQAALAKLKLDTESDLADAHAQHRATIERELADHKKAVAAAQAELETVKTQPANLLKQAKADSEMAARLKDKAAKKLAAFESVAW